RIGVRAPVREDEAPVVRPYLGVSDIEAARRATERPGQGTFAIHILGGIEHGLWQL
ncbi:MAG: hydroxylase, partial [Pseudomonadota bacterium]